MLSFVLWPKTSPTTCGKYVVFFFDSRTPSPSNLCVRLKECRRMNGNHNRSYRVQPVSVVNQCERWTSLHESSRFIQRFLGVSEPLGWSFYLYMRGHSFSQDHRFPENNPASPSSTDCHLGSLPIFQWLSPWEPPRLPLTANLAGAPFPFDRQGWKGKLNNCLRAFFSCWI